MEDKGVFFKWTERMSVSSVEIDNQHRILVGLLNELYQAFLDREHKDKIGTIIERMADYAKVHFDTEEKYFARFSYSDAASHIMDHQQFRQKVKDFMLKYKSNSGALTYDLMNFLRNWLTNHIMNTDRKYIECFTKNGVY